MDLSKASTNDKCHLTIPWATFCQYQCICISSQYSTQFKVLGIASTDDTCHFAISWARSCLYQCVCKILSKYSKRFKISSYGHFSQTEQPHDKTNKVACAPSEASDQTGHPPSLIGVFTVHMKKAWILSYPLSAQRRLWSDWADAQADLSFCWAHMPLCWFCHEVAQLISDGHTTSKADRTRTRMIIGHTLKSTFALTETSGSYILKYLMEMKQTTLSNGTCKENF